MASLRNVGVGRLLARGLIARCANCGGRGLFSRWFTMAERCPTCGHRFERMDGYWLGAIMVNTAASFGLFLLAGGAILVSTWPDVPWNWLTAGLMTLMALFPLIFYPFSKTLWVAMEMAVRPPEPDELAGARRHLEDE